VTVLSLLDVLDEVKSGQLAFVPLRNKLLRPLTLALCTAPRASFPVRRRWSSRS
jgi:hypothetical protein